jgi:hypothetical protein
VVLDEVTDVNAWFQPVPNDFGGLDVDSERKASVLSRCWTSLAATFNLERWKQ